MLSKVNMIKESKYPTIGLYGIGGVYNYGCEAIVRGTEHILRSVWPRVRIVYASLRSEDDRKRLSETNIEVVPRKLLPRWSLPRIGRKLSTYFKSPWTPYVEDLYWLDDCDAILSIGGDLYTLPPKYEELEREFLYNELIHLGEIVKKRGKPFIIWGASIGPFEGFDNTKRVYCEHLKKVDLISVREPVTYMYLDSLGIKENVVMCGDPAFAVPSNYPKKTGNSLKTKIGINLSPLSSLYTFKEQNIESLLNEHTHMICSLIEKFNSDIIFIPHVISEDDFDDDFRYLEAIMKKLPCEIQNSVSIIPPNVGFLGTKKIIAECDVVIAARMHCAVNAIESLTPTIFVAYSQKAYGMAEYIYGNRRWVIPLKELDSSTLLPLVYTVLNELLDIKAYLADRLIEIKDDAFRPVSRLTDIVNMLQ